MGEEEQNNNNGEGFIKAIIDAIEEKGIATFGTDLFSPRWPSTGPDQCMLVASSGGSAPSKEVPIRDVSLQFLFRSKYYPDAEKMAYEIYRIFHGRVDEQTGEWISPHNYQVGDYYVYVSRANQVPHPIGADQNNREEITLNVSFKILEPKKNEGSEENE